MDQDIEIINTNTRNEKIKIFFIKNKNKLISVLVVIIITLFAYFFYEDYKLDKKENLANKYNVAVTKYNSNQKDNVETILKEIIQVKDIRFKTIFISSHKNSMSVVNVGTTMPIHPIGKCWTISCFSFSYNVSRKL